MAAHAWRRRAWLVVAGVLLAATAGAQTVSQRGFLEARGTAYPQTARNDGTRLVGDALFREEASWRPFSWLTLAGAFDARIDTRDRVERSWSIDWSDRGARRPALSVRRASMAGHRGGFTLEGGKQFIRWGKADVLNPTDRFAPRDFLDVVDNEFLAVTAVRGTWERKGDTVDAVWSPRFTPSRIPLLSQRWAVLPASGRPANVPVEPGFGAIPLVDLGAAYPARSQFGIRWNHVASRFELSLSVYDGFNHLPRFDAQFIGLPASVPSPGGDPILLALQFQRAYPRMRMIGGDAAVPNRWFTVKGEVAYFTSPDASADEYGIYVLQVERQSGEWFLVGGYAGEFVTTRRQSVVFAPDRGLANTFLGRASYTIDVNRSVAFEGALRRNGDGAWLRAEFSQSAGQHWRATARANVIRGKTSDFLGQYRRNSNVDLILRYSF